ncbi:hypothetical protein K502DRAFT_325379 [Neoconidiobolus thromboides FSU 785]|nr:hypothetical protein K502DRAFT_325379 [Neoconidiobolus thromboides FSU 785]
MEEARIKFLLLNGAKVEYSFNNQMTIHEVKQRLIENWPGEWMNDKPISILALRLLYLGKILEDFKTLKGKFKLELYYLSHL